MLRGLFWRMIIRARGQEGWSKTLSSEHGRTVVLMNSQQPWFPAQDQASEHSSLEGEGLMRPYSTAEELLTVDSCQEGLVFFKGVASGRSTMHHDSRL